MLGYVKRRMLVGLTCFWDPAGALNLPVSWLFSVLRMLAVVVYSTASVSDSVLPPDVLVCSCRVKRESIVPIVLDVWMLYLGRLDESSVPETRVLPNSWKGGALSCSRVEVVPVFLSYLSGWL